MTSPLEEVLDSECIFYLTLNYPVQDGSLEEVCQDVDSLLNFLGKIELSVLLQIFEDEPTLQLWLGREESCYFLIPETQEFTEGTYRIFNLNGDRRSVDFSAIAPFQITREEAEPFIRTELDQAWQNAKEAFSVFADFAAAIQNESIDPPPNSDPPIDPSPNEPQAEQTTNPNPSPTNFQTLISGFQDLINGVTSDNPADLEAARQRMRSFNQHLQAQGYGTNDNLETLPDKLREKYHDLQADETLKESAQQFQAATEEVGQSFTNLLQTLKTGVEKFKQTLDEINEKAEAEQHAEDPEH